MLAHSLLRTLLSFTSFVALGLLLSATSPRALAQERVRTDNYRDSGQRGDASYAGGDRDYVYGYDDDDLYEDDDLFDDDLYGDDLYDDDFFDDDPDDVDLYDDDDDPFVADKWWERSRYYNEDEWFDPTDWFDGNNYEFDWSAYYGDRRDSTVSAGTVSADRDAFYDHYAFPPGEQNAVEKVERGSYSDSGRPPDRTVTVIARGLDFEPAEIQARPGEKLLIKLVNESQKPHNIEFELPDGEVELEHNVSPGKSASLMFVAPSEPGRYTFYCPVGNHHEQGMQGKLIVGDRRTARRREN